VPLLPHDAPLPLLPRRVLVGGGSGSGKTTLASRVADVLGVPHTEIDALHHGPGWVKRPTFEADVDAFTSEPAWVTEWQYTTVRPLLAERADLVVWLDLPRSRVMRQVTARTLRRWVRREELWNGNREPAPWTSLTHPEGVVRWAWRTHHLVAGRVDALLEQDPTKPVVRLRSHREAAAWVDGPLARARAER
jgi:adenylate kinase family enzyme